jgi:hypothetical protein
LTIVRNARPLAPQISSLQAPHPHTTQRSANTFLPLWKQRSRALFPFTRPCQVSCPCGPCINLCECLRTVGWCLRPRWRCPT